ncbi:ATPase [Mesobacterium sp. TK19101]|uniref:ATPase n=1 Tax=Mesobacterium hydrothermale TaxID=3111907 RepID=A0ABU6HG70_9RHOB|nr:ATPase [Mesobacterium sp. TK19101]MEC3860961.1 ATPase [Mesobacterium sp. TK19101]
MLYQSAQDWRDAPHKRVVLFAMSGLGKTHVSTTLRDTGDWFHYSIDYRIGTRYMGEYIVDSCLAAAMDHPYLREMLLHDAIYIAPNVHTHDLTAVSTYLGKPGDTARGGLPIDEYTRRQAQFKRAEEQALLDTDHFIRRAERVYGYPHFICDTGGSICEWVDPHNPQDPILSALSQAALMVWIRGADDHTEELIRRFDKAPKPMAYQPEFLSRVWADYLSETGQAPDQVDPDAFIRWTYAQALAHRQPRYAAMARAWGITVDASDMAQVEDADSFTDLIARTLESAGKPA